MARRIIPHAPNVLFANTALAVGEVVYDETNRELRVGDGAELGGVVVLSETSPAIISMPVSVQKYGAVGDGIADDTVAIRRAMWENPCVYIPKGWVCKITDVIFFNPAFLTVRLFGEPGAKIVGGHKDVGTLSLHTCDKFHVHDLWLHIDKLSYGALVCFHRDIGELIVERCTLSADRNFATNAVKLVFDNSVKGLSKAIFRDVVIPEAGRMGIEIQNHSNTEYKYNNILIDGLQVRDTGYSDVNGMGISLSGYGRYVSLLNSRFIECRGPAIEYIGAAYVNTINVSIINQINSRAIQCANFRLMPGHHFERVTVVGGTPTDVYFSSLIDPTIKNCTFDLRGGTSAVTFKQGGTPTTGPFGSGGRFIDNEVYTAQQGCIGVENIIGIEIRGGYLDNTAAASTGAIVSYFGTASGGYVEGTTIAKAAGGQYFQQSGAATANILDGYIQKTGAGLVRKKNAAELSGFVAYDPPSIAPATSSQTTLTVTGANLNDQATATFSRSLGGLMISAQVSAANTVTVVLFNPTAAAIDLASGTLTARVTLSSSN